MIICRLHHLIERCRQRGYTFAEVEACIVTRDGETITVDEHHPAYPKRKQLSGDDLIDAMGWTLETAKVDLNRGGCGCSAPRKEES